MSRRRVVVTGLGIVSPLGSDKEAVWSRMLNGESGIDYIKGFDTTNFTTKIGGEVKEFDAEEFIPKKELRRMDPFTVFGIAAAQKAVDDSGLDFDQENRKRVGCVVSTGIGGLQILQNQWSVFIEKGPQRFSPFMIPQMITNIAPGLIAIRFGIQGPNFCITSACASGGNALGESLRMIQHNEADIILAGGCEATVCELGIGGFNAMKALSTKRNDAPTEASRPFDADRDGFVCSEGAAVLTLEEYERAKARGAHIYCELAGYGRTCDAHHITAPLEGGEGASEAMRLAVEDAGLDASEVNYINAHGTSTPLNDKAETKAIKAALGEENARKLAISSTKSMTGHLLGAAAAVEAFACARAIETGTIPPTINYTTPDPDCDLDYTPNEARELKVTACLNNTLGFGGHNASLCFKPAS